jgi:hypothetical protein
MPSHFNPYRFEGDESWNSGRISRKSTRELFGPDEQCYIMDAKSIGNIGRFLNVSNIRLLLLLLVCVWSICYILECVLLFPALMSAKRLCAERIRGHPWHSFPMGRLLCIQAHPCGIGANLGLQLRHWKCPWKNNVLLLCRSRMSWATLVEQKTPNLIRQSYIGHIFSSIVLIQTRVRITLELFSFKYVDLFIE